MERDRRAEEDDYEQNPLTALHTAWETATRRLRVSART